MLPRSTTASISDGTGAFVRESVAVAVSAPMQAFSEYCSLSSCSGLTCVSLCFFDSHRDQLPLLALLMFGPSARGVPTMDSADFWLSLSTPLDADSTWQ